MNLEYRISNSERKVENNQVRPYSPYYTRTSPQVLYLTNIT
jgi:hypothetical protein